MITKFIEAYDETRFNWGKFSVAKFEDHEWLGTSVVDNGNLLRNRGWSHQHIWVLDLQTGEGAYFKPGGLASCDLNKHRIWVCPMFESFLCWLYQQDLSDISKLPAEVNLGNVPTDVHGYRRQGPEQAQEA